MEESLFGGIRFDRFGDALDNDDDDDAYGSRGSEFETESLGSSSTDEDEPLPAMLDPSHHLCGDMIGVCKIAHNIYDPKVLLKFKYNPKSCTRGKSKKGKCRTEYSSLQLPSLQCELIAYEVTYCCLLPAEVTFPPLPQPIKDGCRFKYDLFNHTFHYYAQKLSFLSHIVNMWNSLPNTVVNVDT